MIVKASSLLPKFPSATVGLEIIKKGLFQFSFVHDLVASQTSSDHSVVDSQAVSVHCVVASQAELVIVDSGSTAADISRGWVSDVADKRKELLGRIFC